MSHLFCFGMGYSAHALGRRLATRGWRITGTSRTIEGVRALAREGYNGVLFDGTAPIEDFAGVFNSASHVLSSVPPDENGDPVIRVHGDDLARMAPNVAWAGYLSTTGVYGDRGGQWVDEWTVPEPTTERGKRRRDAEEAWLKLAATTDFPVHIFRLAGIYGPRRNQLVQVREGRARRIIRNGQVFSRIHVEDIAGVLEASIAAPAPTTVYNVCDDEPAPPQDVIAYAARLCGSEMPPEVAFEDAELSPMARSFYAENKRVSNERIKRDLGYVLRYPTYREGLASLVEADA